MKHALTIALTAAVLATAAQAEDDYGAKMVAELEGATEVPGPGDEDGFGTFTARIQKGELCYNMVVEDIETATAAHIHEGAEGSAGGVAVSLKVPKKGESEIDHCARMSSDVAAAIEAAPENFYVNVHNEAFPAGAIRGQLMLDE